MTNKENIVCGVDPGSHSAGVAVVEGNKLLLAITVDSLTGAKWDDNNLGDYMVEFMLTVQEALDKYNPELLVIELTSVPTNMHTNKLLSYWEACAIIAASMSKINIKRVRTKEARKAVLGRGNINKKEAIKYIKEIYGDDYTEDECEAILFALYGISIL